MADEDNSMLMADSFERFAQLAQYTYTDDDTEIDGIDMASLMLPLQRVTNIPKPRHGRYLDSPIIRNDKGSLTYNDSFFFSGDPREWENRRFGFYITHEIIPGRRNAEEESSNQKKSTTQVTLLRNIGIYFEDDSSSNLIGLSDCVLSIPPPNSPYPSSNNEVKQGSSRATIRPVYGYTNSQIWIPQSFVFFLFKALLAEDEDTKQSEAICYLDAHPKEDGGVWITVGSPMPMVAESKKAITVAMVNQDVKCQKQVYIYNEETHEKLYQGCIGAVVNDSSHSLVGRAIISFRLKKTGVTPHDVDGWTLAGTLEKFEITGISNMVGPGLINGLADNAQIASQGTNTRTFNAIKNMLSGSKSGPLAKSRSAALKEANRELVKDGVREPESPTLKKRPTSSSSVTKPFVPKPKISTPSEASRASPKKVSSDRVETSSRSARGKSPSPSRDGTRHEDDDEEGEEEEQAVSSERSRRAPLREKAKPAPVVTPKAAVSTASRLMASGRGGSTRQRAPTDSELARAESKADRASAATGEEPGDEPEFEDDEGEIPVSEEDHEGEQPGASGVPAGRKNTTGFPDYTV